MEALPEGMTIDPATVRRLTREAVALNGRLGHGDRDMNDEQRFEARQRELGFLRAEMEVNRVSDSGLAGEVGR